MAQMLMEPKVGKRVWWVEICPKHEAEQSLFSSLIEPSCSNCKYKETVKADSTSLDEEYCRYPNKQTD